MLRTLLTTVFVLIAGAAHAHGEAQWIMDNPATSFCCGPQDCRPLQNGEAYQRDGKWYVNGHHVPANAVYPTGDGTARYWGCFDMPALVVPRCLFIPALF